MVGAASAAGDAATFGCRLLEELGSSNKPTFLPSARGLLFYSAIRAGCGIGFQEGSGFVVARQPFSSESPHSGAWWSPPCFVRVHGLESGIVVGAERVDALIGIMSERALRDLMSGGKLVLGTEFSVSIGAQGGRSKHGELMLSPDLCCMAVNGSGGMLDVGVSGCMFLADKHKNKEAYGEGATAAVILGGGVETPTEMAPLAQAVSRATHAACVASFDRSGSSSTGD